jgi:hypothetical protein
MPKLREDLYSRNIEDRRAEFGDPNAPPRLRFFDINRRADLSRLPLTVPDDATGLSNEAGFEDIGSRPAFMKPAPDGISADVFRALDAHGDEKKQRILDFLERKNGGNQ